MKTESFEEWVKGLDRGFRVKDTKTAFLVDNCPVHPAVEALLNIKLIFYHQI